MLAPALCHAAPVSWGDSMKRERVARAWTQTEAARRIGAVEGTIRSLEEAETQPVRSKHARSLMALYGLGENAVDATNPRLLSATPRQLARRLAALLEADEGPRVKHDQSNVSPGHEQWRRVPVEYAEEEDEGA